MSGAGDSGGRGGHSSVTLWLPRVVAGLACLVLLVLVIWQFGGLGPSSSGSDTSVDPDAPDQVVVLRALRTAHFQVLVDGEVVLDRELPGGERFEAAGHHRVEVRLEGADTARVEYNGDLVRPQGRQDVPRRLVFIDDLDTED